MVTMGRGPVALLLVLCFIGTLGIAVEQDATHVIRKRHAFNFCKMIQHKTGRRCTDFLFHGNFCGLGGSGIPVDHLDFCCFMHDNCFSYTKQMCRTHTLRLLWSSYRWTMMPSVNDIMCDPGQSFCSRQQCECDRDFSICVGNIFGGAPPRTLHNFILEKGF